jgi:hypothetical protein
MLLYILLKGSDDAVRLRRNTNFYNYYKQVCYLIEILTYIYIKINVVDS